MIERQTKMGKRSSKFHAHKKSSSPEDSLFSVPREYFSTDRSDDSGLGSDASNLFGDTSVTCSTGPESDLDNSFDSSYSSASSSAVVVPTSSHKRGGRLQIDTNLAFSLNDKMRIHVVDQTEPEVSKPRIASVFSLAEPMVKRRKLAVSGQGCCAAAADFAGFDRHLLAAAAADAAPRENGLQKFVRAQQQQLQQHHHQQQQQQQQQQKQQQQNGNRSLHVVGNGVLTEAAVCHNALSKRKESNCLTADDGSRDHRSPWSTRENFGQGLRGEDVGDDRIASLLTATTLPFVGSAGRKKLARKPSLHVCFPSRSKELGAELSILVQPEEQHRARYMTEGSRGSIKDDNGNSFPKVKLCGYKQPVVLQVFIGSDSGKIQPHLFYQACKVTGKNCTPCIERMVEGTSVIEINMLPENDMTVSCDCIGILKERNVDVEQRLPYFGLARCKKRSTKCRMVFRINVPLPNGNFETLQISSSQILCTQSPGLPEICKKSLAECSAKGGTELFIIGKNFQKDVKVLFQELKEGDDETGVGERRLVWEDIVEPEKEFLHQTHLICSVPPYRDGGIMFPVKVYLSVLSGGKSSEPHTFTYTPCRSVSNDNRYFGCNTDFSLPSSHSPLEFCKSEQLPLSSPVPSEAVLMHSSILSSPVMAAQMPASSCPASPVNVMPTSMAMQLISPPQPPSDSQKPISPSSTSLKPELPMSIMESVMVHEHMQQQQQQQQQHGCLKDHPSAPLSSSSPLSSMSSSSPVTTSSEHNESNDLACHDVDLMKKIDQLANEMSRAEDASRASEERHLGLSMTPAMVAPPMAANHNVNDGAAMLAAVNDSIQCNTSPDVSAMVTSDANCALQTSMFVLSAEMEKPGKQADDPQREMVSIMTAIPDAYQLDHHNSAAMLDFKSKYAGITSLQTCPQPMPVADTDTNTAATANHEDSISYNVHCCSGRIVSSAASCTSTTSSPANDVSVNGNGNGEPVALSPPTSVPVVKPLEALPSASASASASDQMKSGKSGAQPDMMTLQFSQLSDADLLSMINPSTFDSV